MRVAQIVDNKAYWIFETNESIEQVKNRFCPEFDFVDITNNKEVQEGWSYDGLTFSTPPEPTAEEILQQRIDSLNDEYLPQFEKLKQAFLSAQLSSNQGAMTEITTSYQALWQDYNSRMEVIQNG